MESSFVCIVKGAAFPKRYTIFKCHEIVHSHVVVFNKGDSLENPNFVGCRLWTAPPPSWRLHSVLDGRLLLQLGTGTYSALTPKSGHFLCHKLSIGLLQLTITWYKIAMLEGKLIIIPALGHQNKETWTSEVWFAFVLMSHCGNNNEIALHHGRFCTTWSLVAKGLLVKGNQFSWD